MNRAIPRLCGRYVIAGYDPLAARVQEPEVGATAIIDHPPGEECQWDWLERYNGRLAIYRKALAITVIWLCWFTHR